MPAGRRRGDPPAHPRAAGRGRALGLGSHRHPRPVAAAHLAPPEAARRGRARRAPPGGRLGVLPPRRPAASAPRILRPAARRASTAPTSSSPTTARGSPRCASSAPRRRRPSSPGSRRNGTGIRSLHAPEDGGRGGGARGARRDGRSAPPRSRHRHRPHAAAPRARAPRGPSGSMPATPCSRSRAPTSSRPASTASSCARATSTRRRCRATPSTSWSSTRCCTISTIRPGRCARRRGSSSPGGRLLVVDFAPHGLEFLREEPGPSPPRLRREQVAGWLAEAGLDCTLTRDLAPPKSGEDAAHRLAVARPGPPRSSPIGPWLDPNRRSPDEPAAFRPSRHGARPIRVSFEFFPPKTPEMEATLWASIERLAPLEPAVRLGHLRRRRLDPRAHPRHRRAPRRETPL